MGINIPGAMIIPGIIVIHLSQVGDGWSMYGRCLKELLLTAFIIFAEIHSNGSLMGKPSEEAGLALVSHSEPHHTIAHLTLMTRRRRLI
jgi:hypothetical protein